MGKKKKFIDKKKSATFQLIARDSSDPNYDDETPGSDRVFVRVDNHSYSVDTFFPDGGHDDSGNPDSNSIFADAPEDTDDGEEEDRVFGNPLRSHTAALGQLPEHVRKEILELGFPDDGYNYLTHLREIKNTGGGSNYYHNSKARLDLVQRDVKAYDASRVQILQVNSNPDERSVYSVASKTLDVRVQKAVDHEVAALLDDSDLSRFGSDVEDLEEDFVVQANLPEEGDDVFLDKKMNLDQESEVTQEVINKSNASSYQENSGDLGGVDKVKNHLAETGDECLGDKPRVRRPLDEQFDLLELQEYGTDNDDDYDGYIAEEDDSIAQKLKHALNDRVMDDLELDDKYKVPADVLRDNDKPKSKEILDSAAAVIRRCVEYAENYENEDEDDVVFLQESSDESEVWDCETVVSTYSNLDNHPGKIEAPETSRKKKLAETVSGVLNSKHVISLRGKEKLPVDFLSHNRKATVEKVKSVGGSRTEEQKRKEHSQESKEEKKERKAAVKEERREARRVKKEMKELYRCETQRAQKVAAISGPSSIHLM